MTNKRRIKKEIEKEIELDNYARELEKCDNILGLAQRFLAAHAEMNAALHADPEVVYSSLYNRCVEARKGIKMVLRKHKRKVAKKEVKEEDLDKKLSDETNKG